MSNPTLAYYEASDRADASAARIKRLQAELALAIRLCKRERRARLKAERERDELQIALEWCVSPPDEAISVGR
jgi:hypothetical protein